METSAQKITTPNINETKLGKESHGIAVAAAALENSMFHVGLYNKQCNLSKECHDFDRDEPWRCAMQSHTGCHNKALNSLSHPQRDSTKN